MERQELEVVAKRRHTLLNRATLLEKGIKIPNPKQFMWTQMKQNYDKHVERMENWKDIVKEEDWASKIWLLVLFLMDWQASMPDVMLEFFNTFVIKGCKYLFWA
jgi:hypothetical protein